MNSRGNYNKENRRRVFRLPKEQSERQKWLDVIPPYENFVVNPDKFFISEIHWGADPPLIKLRGGSMRPGIPSSIFNVPASCLPSPKLTPRPAKEENQQLRYLLQKNKIISFDAFKPERNLQKQYKNLIISRSKERLACLFMTDNFSECNLSVIVENKPTLCSPLTLSAFKNGISVPLFKILHPNNGLRSYTQFDEIVRLAMHYDITFDKTIQNVVTLLQAHTSACVDTEKEKKLAFKLIPTSFEISLFVIDEIVYGYEETTDEECRQLAISKDAHFFITNLGYCDYGTLRYPLCSTPSGNEYEFHVDEKFVTDGSPSDDYVERKEGKLVLIANADKISMTDGHYLIDPACYTNSSCGIPIITTAVELVTQRYVVLHDVCGQTIDIGSEPGINVLSHEGIGCKFFPDVYPVSNCEVTISGSGPLKWTPSSDGTTNAVDVCTENAPTEFTATAGKVKISFSAGAGQTGQKYGFIISITK
ncbi:hypothetical protein FHG87_020235 [Trinorchestia longiramus]|nr:hypothetical protein FHG87_020235 [Trinorchestia longiramus]